MGIYQIVYPEKISVPIVGAPTPVTVNIAYTEILLEFVVVN